MNLIHVGYSLLEKESFVPLVGTVYAPGAEDGCVCPRGTPPQNGTRPGPSEDVQLIAISVPSTHPIRWLCAQLVGYE